MSPCWQKDLRYYLAVALSGVEIGMESALGLVLFQCMAEERRGGFMLWGGKLGPQPNIHKYVENTLCQVSRFSVVRESESLDIDFNILFSFFLHLGRPVDSCDHIDYIPILFAYSKPRVEISKQKEECQRRVDRRRQVAEAAEFGKGMQWLKCDVRCVSVTLEVVLPSTSSDFQSAHSEVTCTV